MKGLRIIFSAALLLLSASIWAQRTVPADMRVAVLEASRGREVVLRKATWSPIQTLSFNLLGSDRQTYPINAAVRVRNEKNLFEPYGRLVKYSGKTVAVRFDNQNRINEIWILTDKERADLKDRAKEQEQITPR
ncbi:hypothetical protein [Stenoxybacter acetivorans]|uniref:hypothetical protein n=1 Tax=Stenoxybacter acetivorans TaxID=422441 RepID=UPI0012EC527F|nr:hypothetical protein [Stenoxybacter acetivorans]